MYTVIRSDTFRKWFKKLKDNKAKVLILMRLKRVEKGNLGDCESVQGKISELKFDIGPGYRIYFTLQDKAIVLLLYAGNKSSQKRDIKKAKKILTDWEVKNERKI